MLYNFSGYCVTYINLKAKGMQNKTKICYVQKPLIYETEQENL